jgi:hypothetical protein
MEKGFVRAEETMGAMSRGLQELEKRWRHLKKYKT